MSRHEVPERLFLMLARGGGGPEAITLLKAAQRSRRLVLLQALRTAPYSLLAEIQRTSRSQVDAVLHYPTVGAWARARLSTPTTPDLFPVLAAAAAIRAAHPCSLDLPRDPTGLTLPSLGRLVLPHSAPMARLTVTDGGAEIDGIRLPADPGCATEHWQPLRILTAEHRGLSVRLVLDDLDPCRAPGTKPAERVSDAEVGRWRELLGPAWRMLVDDHPDVAAEIAAALTVLTPMRVTEGHASATFYAAFGSIGSSLPPNPLWFALTLVHELGHVKLTGLLDLIPLLLPDDGRLFYAPWRDDPRPLSGLLQGTYAHQCVAEFWAVRRKHSAGDRAHREFAHWREASANAARTLATSDRLTPAGERFVAAMSSTLDALRAQPVPSRAAEEAAAAATLHRTRWDSAHGSPAHH